MNRPSLPVRAARLRRRAGRGSVLAVLLFFTITSIAVAGMLEDRLAQTRAEGRSVKAKIGTIETREQRVVRQISALNRKIATLDGPLRKLEQQIAGLEYRIAQREKRIEKLRRDYAKQRITILRLNRELDAAKRVLTIRLVAAYKSGETGLVEQLAGSGSLTELFEREATLSRVLGIDRELVERIDETETKVRLKRARNHEMRRDIQDDIDGLEADRAAIDAKRADAQRRRDEVAEVKAVRDASLRVLRSQEQELVNRLDDIEEDARVLQDVIENGATAYAADVSGASPAGLIWPVSGPVVSPFGPRWGRMHEGIDIAVGAGNPIYAAAAGIVTHAGCMSGYGNLVIVQHGGGLSTSYAHQSRIASAVGQPVRQGQLLGFVGCTGHCYGDHLHFETRVNGAAQDPMQYL